MRTFIILLSFVSTIKDRDVFRVTCSGIQRDEKMKFTENELLLAAIIGTIEGIAIILLTVTVIICCRRYIQELKGPDNTVHWGDDCSTMQGNQTREHVYEGLQITTTASKDHTHTQDFMDTCKNLRSICTMCCRYRQELNGPDNTVHGDNDYSTLQGNQTSEQVYENQQITTAATHTPDFMHMCDNVRSICTICCKYRQELNGPDNEVHVDDDYCTLQINQTGEQVYENLQITTAATHTPDFIDSGH